MSEIKRYQTLARHSMQGAPNGLYVYYADHARIVAETRGLLETIQQALVNQHWQTLGDVYRGKTLFLSQDLLNKIDTALDGDAQ